MNDQIYAWGQANGYDNYNAAKRALMVAAVAVTDCQEGQDLLMASNLGAPSTFNELLIAEVP